MMMHITNVYIIQHSDCSECCHL